MFTLLKYDQKNNTKQPLKASGTTRKKSSKSTIYKYYTFIIPTEQFGNWPLSWVKSCYSIYYLFSVFVFYLYIYI